MKNILLFIAAVLFTDAAIAQDRNITRNDPDQQIIVKKEFDDQGNMLRYDSTFVLRWSDTTFTFPEFGGWTDFFRNRKIYSELLSDSTFSGMPFFRDFPGRFFADNWPSTPFSFGFPDSVLFRKYSFQADTTLFLGPDSSFLLPPGFFMPDVNSLRHFFREFEDLTDDQNPFRRFFFNQPSPDTHRFFNDDQRREWEILMEKHRKEMEELQRKWKNNERNQID